MQQSLTQKCNRVDTLGFAEKADLASLRTTVDKLYIDELKKSHMI